MPGVRRLRRRKLSSMAIAPSSAAMPGNLRASWLRQGRLRAVPSLKIDGASVVVDAGKGQTATVWLVRYDPVERQVAIRAGENGGRTLPHRNIVRELIRLGEWSGSGVRYMLAVAKEPRLRSAVFIQQGAGGPIIAAIKG